MNLEVQEESMISHQALHVRSDAFLQSRATSFVTVGKGVTANKTLEFYIFPNVTVGKYY